MSEPRTSVLPAAEPVTGSELADPRSQPAPNAVPEPGAAPTRRQVAEGSAARRWRNRVQLRTSVTLGLFAVGLLAGVVGWRLLNPAEVPVDVYPSLPKVAEPAAAALVAGHLRANDAIALGEQLDEETLSLIRQQLSPLTTVDRMDFKGSTSLGSQTLVAYIVEGRDGQGARGIIGLILIVRDGTVVAK